ncbi:TPA: hypothetical protein ACGOW0_001406 [Streptococcus suis]
MEQEEYIKSYSDNQIEWYEPNNFNWTHFTKTHKIVKGWDETMIQEELRKIVRL